MTAPIGQFVDSTSGRTSTSPFITIIEARAPTGNDGINNGLQVGQRWVDTSTDNEEYFLLGFVVSNGYVQANWVLLTASSSNLTFVTDSGNAVTAGNIINILGADGITTSGIGDTVTITGSGSVFPWVNVTTNTQLMAANTGYIMSNGGALVTLTIPASAAIGDTYIIQGQSAGGWKVNVNTGQTLNIGNSATTVTTGSVASTNQWDSLTVRCTTANTTFSAGPPVGNYTII